jgi:3-hydroxybutyryl-CoA dehydrogenase
MRRPAPAALDEATPQDRGFTHAGVIGGGIMGSGIAEVCARADVDVVLVEVDHAAGRRARARVEESLERAVERGKVDTRVAGEALGRITVVHDQEALADRDVVIEAVTEDKASKLAVFRLLAQVVERPDALLASNTSSIPIVELAAAADDRAEHVLGLHFFNPVPVLPLVEIVPSLLTSDGTAERARSFAEEQLGKEPIVAADRAGFTVNALLIPYLLSAIRMFEQGLATAEDIDLGMVKGCAHPMGPLALADLIGLDTVLGVAETLYAEHREPLYAPPPLLRRLVAAGLLGRKSQRGLYSYQ